MASNWQKLLTIPYILITVSLGGCSLSSEQVAQKAKAITVIIDGCGAASGIIYRRDGNTYSVLTVAHAVKFPTLTCLIFTPDGDVHKTDANISQPVSGVDLGILKFSTQKNYKLAEWGDSDELVEGKTVYVAGAPQSTEAIPARTIIIDDGKIVGRADQPLDGYVLIYDASTQPGMSGGPVLDVRGRVVGIHGRGDRDARDMKTGWNLGIPIGMFLESQGYSVVVDYSRYIWLCLSFAGVSLVFVMFRVALPLQKFGSEAKTVNSEAKETNHSPQEATLLLQKFGSEAKTVNPEAKETNRSPQEATLPLQKFNFQVKTVNSSGKETNRRRQEAEFFAEDLGNGVILEMVYIPGGSFLMGSPETEKKRDNDETPQHRVTVQPFFMAKYPVTQRQYEIIVGKNPSYFKGQNLLETILGTGKGKNLPVENVSWNDAVEFCQKLTEKTGSKRKYRLPSEAEWEYATRAGTTTPFYFGETITTELANYDGTSIYASEPKGVWRQKTTEVGSFPPNAFGLYDMHGNVSEWCQDVWHENYTDAPADGSAWEVGGDSNMRVLRGGSWYNVPGGCRCADRDGYYADYCDYSWGFRVVCLPGILFTPFLA